MYWAIGTDVRDRACSKLSRGGVSEDCCIAPLNGRMTYTAYGESLGYVQSRALVVMLGGSCTSGWVTVDSQLHVMVKCGLCYANLIVAFLDDSV